METHLMKIVSGTPLGVLDFVTFCFLFEKGERIWFSWTNVSGIG